MQLVFTLILSLAAVFFSFIFTTKAYQYIIREVRKMKRLKRREAMFNVNPRRANRIRTIFNRLAFLSTQNRADFEQQVKFVYGEIFELDNTHTTVDTKKILDINIDKWEKAFRTTTQRIIIRWRRSASHALIHSFYKRATARGKMIGSGIHRIMTKYIQNNGGRVNEEADRNEF